LKGSEAKDPQKAQNDPKKGSKMGQNGGPKVKIWVQTAKICQKRSKMTIFGQNPKIPKTPKGPLQKHDVLKGLLTKLPIVKSQFRWFCQKWSKMGFSSYLKGENGQIWVKMGS
jgi:hypothetical protein